MKTKTYVWIACGAVVAYIVYIKLVQSGQVGGQPSGSGSISTAGTASGQNTTGGTAAGGQGADGSTDVISTWDGWINQLLGV